MEGTVYEMQNNPKENKVEIFLKWCKDNGVVCPKLEYPAVFDMGLVGVRAKEDI